MRLNKAGSHTRGASVAVLAAFVALGLAGCDSTTGDEQGTTVEDIQEDDATLAYNGIYDSDFYGDLETYEGQEVTVSADVNEIISDNAFTIAGGDVESLLVISGNAMTDLEQGSVIKVTGTVHTALDLPAVEDEVGVDLEDDLYDAWDQEPYITATNIDTNPDTE